MKRLWILGLMIVAIMSLLAGGVFAQAAAKNTYVGDAKCKMCHKDNHASWLDTKHAKAFAALKPEEQKKPECVKCHTTGANAENVVLENVQCEACHGPGSAYGKASVMSAAKFKADSVAARKAWADAGLVMPKEADCVRCHTKEGNANFKEFVFAKAKDMVHPKKAAAGK